MKKIIAILAFIPFIINAQLTPDSLIGCYAGTYRQWSDDEPTWDNTFNDTLIVYYLKPYSNDELRGKAFILSDNSEILYNENNYTSDEFGYKCFTEYGFNNFYTDIDLAINQLCPYLEPIFLFYNYDSLAFIYKCWKSSQTSPEKNVEFFGKKYTSEIPDSLQHITVPKIKSDLIINIFPNPTTNIVHIKLNNKNIKQYKLYNIDGVILLSSNINTRNFNINISTFNKGLYFIEFSTSDGIFTRKIIKI